MSAFRLLLLFFLWIGSVLHAEPVALKNGLGQGLLFQFRSQCYVLFPSHVHTAGPVLNLFTSSPQASGTATIYFRRPEADFALGVVRGGARARCGSSFSQLTRDVSRLLSTARRATLERVNPQGGIDKLAMRIDQTKWDASVAQGGGGLYQFLFASTDTDAGEARELFQGSSGAFLYVDDVPVAMVVTAPNATSVRALRIEEMVRPLEAWLTSGSFGALAEATTEVAPSVDGMAYAVTGWVGQVVDGASPPTDLSNGRPFRVIPTARGASVVLELDEKKPVAVGALVLSAPTDLATFATPKSIEVEVDRTRPGRTNFTAFASGEMIPEEDLTIPINTFARQIRISVNSSWAPDLPIEISGIRVVPSN